MSKHRRYAPQFGVSIPVDTNRRAWCRGCLQYQLEAGLLEKRLEALAEENEPQAELIILRLESGWTLQRIGDNLGVTRERARMLEREAIDHLRKGCYGKRA